ncbi:hypothetical protein GQX73_g6910 [Xylaria multiplex]|uniref:Uncharacterized protein n=1 Tax=Xylaria multiplex TaxID=323545 RepID=A0A7C8MVM4_9PEZI|nr:hypothetical protein GQX73_g6910 [Xylaria multiplex]
MAQAAGLSYSTARTTWVSSTSPYLIELSFIIELDYFAKLNYSIKFNYFIDPNCAIESSYIIELRYYGSGYTDAFYLNEYSGNLPNAYWRCLSVDPSANIPYCATALVGGLLGVVAGLFLAKRRKKHEPLPEYVACLDREKAPSPTNTLELDQFLLEPKPEATIASELLSLGHIIQRHAEKHYHLHPVQLESNQLRQPLSDLGIERGSAPAIARIASLALEPRTRLSAIRYVIAKAAFESTVIGGSTCVSLLPPVVSGMSPIVPFIGGDEVTELAITRWRQLSAFLLHPNRSQRAPLEPSEDISTQQAQQLTVALIRFLQPFISSDREERYEQENHLREVIAECATFGYVIFSQPSEYRFRFESNGGLNTIVVCPGLDKVISEGGRRYMPPLPQVAAPVVESI